MNPRSLVGMTQGARKRSAARLIDDTFIRALRRALETGERFSVTALERHARARYRIGERLRPCPYCPRNKSRCPDCKGSGVLPAKRAGR